MQDIGFPTSKSVLWQWTKSQYRGWSWDNWPKIPNRITSSTWLAERYARKIEEVARKTQKKVVVVEWGGGTGAFAYCLLNRVSKDALAHYLFCDLQPDMPSVLSSHPQMKDYFVEGRIGFYVADFEQVELWTDFLEQRFTKEVVYVMIFNYMIDALPSDVWHVTGEDAVAKPAGLVMDGKGYKPWVNRDINDMRFRLEVGSAWVPTQDWYRSLVGGMSALGGAGAVYNVPVVTIEVWHAIKKKIKQCVLLVCDVPLVRVPSEDIKSPFFVDGMTASAVDFEMLGNAMRWIGADVWTGPCTPGIELQMSGYSWGIEGLDWYEPMSIATFFWLMTQVQALRGEWSFKEVLSYLELSHHDTWLLGKLMDRSAGIDIVLASDRTRWLGELKKIENNIYWIRDSLDWLHIATLYRWQKDFASCYAALMQYVKVASYDHAYWYCMGYWLYDQSRYYDAIDAWNKAIDNDDHYEALLRDDIAQAELKIRSERL